MITECRYGYGAGRQILMMGTHSTLHVDYYLDDFVPSGPRKRPGHGVGTLCTLSTGGPGMIKPIKIVRPDEEIYGT